MPAHGEQHVQLSNSPHISCGQAQSISKFTATEIATLSSRLEKQLGPEYISARPGANGGKVHYITADKCISLANQVFGFNGWCSSIQSVQVDFVDENPATGKVSLGLSVIVRVTLRDGTYHEDIGYGHIENCKGKAPAFEKAKKEGTTDALKRSLRNFGNVLGNCLYDKEYVARATKLKSMPAQWNPETLHRHQNFAPADTLPTLQKSDVPRLCQDDLITLPRRVERAEDEFGSDDFDEVDFCVPQDETPDGLAGEQKSERIIAAAGSGDTQTDVNFKQIAEGGTAENHAKARISSGIAASPLSAVGFYTARHAEFVQSGAAEAVVPFNIHQESPSIRRTAGFDHHRTRPIQREQAQPVASTNGRVDDQSLATPDKVKRTGLTGTKASFSQSAYRAPQIKRSTDNDHRHPLNDMTNSSNNLDEKMSPSTSKRQKTNIAETGMEPRAKS